MLDFLVLGIVPGTNFVITLRWALIFGLVFMLSLLAYIELSKPVKDAIEKASETVAEPELA